MSQDRMALASQLKAGAAQQAGFFDAEITPVTVAQKKGDSIMVTRDEHPRETSIEALAKLAVQHEFKKTPCVWRSPPRSMLAPCFPGAHP